MYPSPCVRPLAALSLCLLFAACSGGGGDGGLGSQNPITPPPGSVSPPYTTGLLAASAASEMVFLHWKLPSAGFEAALYMSEGAAQLYDTAPIVEGIAGSGMEFAGLLDGTTYFFGLGVREIGAMDYVRAGVVLRARPGQPYYVDADADPDLADGMGPGTAFVDLAAALVQAQQDGIGNVLVKSGTYAAHELEVDVNVHIYGGFDDTFQLSNRDPQDVAQQTLVVGGDGAVAFNLRTVGTLVEPAILDGLSIRSTGAGLVGIEIDGIEAELRCLSIGNFRHHGIRIRNSSITEELDVQISDSMVSGNGTDGLSLAGAFDLRVYGCSFNSNGQEGLECNAIQGIGFKRSRVLIEGSRFFGNGTDGLDIDLAAVDPPNGPSGFDVDIRGCRFERNGVNGLVVDHDFEAVQGYDANIIVRESVARANRGRGMSIDSDGVGSTLIHRSLATANGQEGFFVQSEGITGFAILSASAATANQGAGARSAGGAKPILATHCVFAGNLVGGLHNNVVEGTSASSIAYLQREPWYQVRTAGTVEVNQTTLSTFVEVPEFFTRAIGHDGNRIRVEDPSGIAPGSVLELADDGIEYIVINVFNGEVSLSPEPPPLTLPATVAIHPPGLGVDEDYRLPVGSPARDAGLFEPMADSVDAGIFSSPDPGDPGVGVEVASELFYPTDTVPSLSGGLPRNAALEIKFNREVASSAVLLGRVRAVTADGTEILAGLMSVGDELILIPPDGDWGPRNFVVELHVGLAAGDGATLTTPMTLPIRVR